MKIKSIHGKEYIPVYATAGAAGADILAWVQKSPLLIQAGEIKRISTGLFVEFGPDRHIQVVSRSGLAARGIVVANSPGIIDSDYRGEIQVLIHNRSRDDFYVNDKDRIAQIVVVRHFIADFELVNDLTDTSRGSGGFGSTGTGQIVS